MDEFVYELYELANELHDECAELALQMNCVEAALFLHEQDECE